jgi:hypothetical protein
LGADVKTLERICHDDEEAAVLLREVTTERKGGDRKSETYKQSTKIKNNNIMVDPAVQGTSKAYQIERLKKEKPELYQKVKEKKLSANAAMIEAGFREKAITVPLNVKKAAKVLKKHFGEQVCSREDGSRKASSFSPCKATPYCAECSAFKLSNSFFLEQKKRE